MVQVDTRPPGLNVLFRPGATLTVQLTWPPGSLTGRTFSSTLYGAALSLSVVGDVMTITATVAQTAAATQPANWVLIETIASINEPIMIGKWHPSDEAGSATETVTVSQGSVSVSVVAGIATAVGNLTVGGLLTLGKGIANEGRSFSSNELFTASTRINSNGLPRIVLPNGVTTSVFAGPVGITSWWLTHGLTIGFDVANDHSAGGNCVWRLILRKFNSFGSMASPTIALDSTRTLGAPGAGNLFTVTDPAWMNINITPDGFGSLYCLELQRLAGDAADTVEGPMALTEIAWNRGNL